MRVSQNLGWMHDEPLTNDAESVLVQVRTTSNIQPWLTLELRERDGGLEITLQRENLSVLPLQANRVLLKAVR